MSPFASLFRSARPAAARIELVTVKPALEEPRSFGRQRAADDHLFFAVRSFAVTGRRHTLQYAFVDDRGNHVFSGFVSADSPVGVGARQPPEDLVVEPFDSATFESLLSRLCTGARLITFGRVLQGGLLPLDCVRSAISIDCAWRRFLEISRQRRFAFDRNEPLTLTDALICAGLPAPRSQDAAERALSIRALWGWMDDVDLHQPLIEQ